MADQDGIDPRHDPIYQRGYDPAVHGDPGRTEAPATRRSRARRPADLDLFAAPASRTGASAADPPTGQAPRVAAPPWDADEREEPDDGLDFLRPSITRAEPTTEPSAAPLAPDRPAPGNPASGALASGTPAVAPWRNPYLLGLVVGGAVLALVGFQMFRAALESIYVDFAQTGLLFGGSESGAEESPDITGELVSMQIGWSIGPLLLLIGVTAILAAVIFVAVRWRPVASALPEGHPEGRP